METIMEAERDSKVAAEARGTVAVAIASQKGGVGKSTTTVMLATLLNYETDLKVAVVDVDPQRSAAKLREAERNQFRKAKEENLTNDAVVNAVYELKKKGKTYYDIYPIDYRKIKLELKEKGFAHDDDAVNVVVIEKSKAFKSSGKYDVIFYDLPGYTGRDEYSYDEGKGVLYLELLRQIDYVLVPLAVDMNTVKSNNEYLKMLLKMKLGRERGLDSNSLKDFAGFMWRFSKQKNTKEYNLLAERLRGSGIKVFDSKVFDSNEIQMNFSSIRLVDLPGEKNLVNFMNEFMAFCGLNKAI